MGFVHPVKLLTDLMNCDPNYDECYFGITFLPIQLMQIAVTEHNGNEGESFTYIFDDVSQETFDKLKSGWSEMLDERSIELEENSPYTKDLIVFMNKRCRNGYMKRYGFYKLPEIPEEVTEEYFFETFYKAVKLEKI